jgi:hypothetical protein
VALDAKRTGSPSPANEPRSERLRFPALLEQIFADELSFRPVPPGDRLPGTGARLKLPGREVTVSLTTGELDLLTGALRAGALTSEEASAALADAHLSDALTSTVGGGGDEAEEDWDRELALNHKLDKLALLAVSLIDRAQSALLEIEPLSEVQFAFSDEAKAALALGFEAMGKRGAFPLRPRGAKRFEKLNQRPCGALHFVSASDLDGGYFYTMGIAFSPEAQALGTMDLTFGLDGELIVPGQAVSPIPPFLALATRLFAVSIPTSSNISEEVQSIPMRNFPHPAAIDDLAPVRGGRLKPTIRPRNSEEAITELRRQLLRFDNEQARTKQHLASAVESEDSTNESRVGASFDVTGLNSREIGDWLRPVLADGHLAKRKSLISLYLDIEPTAGDRVAAINQVVDAARQLGLRYVAVADDAEDSWLPNLLEYVEPAELDAVADYADSAGIVVVDGRPVDPVYTAATAAQRIQSVYTTLSVDILKMGMWLCLDALTARQVWREILANPHIPSHMLLMPIGIVEPWNAFVDNRDPSKTPRAILDPFEKIKFMIEEAAHLGIPSLLTDTRHKATWVLLGRKTEADEPHLRERFELDPATGDVLGRTPDSAIPLLSWEQFMECERLAREAGILLGQAGSIEGEQTFRVIAETTLDAAREGKNPATAFWTAETERVLRLGPESGGGDLQSERSAQVSPFLAVINRGSESAAKLNGWLRYLAEQGVGEPELLAELENGRERLLELLRRCLGSQRHDPSRYQSDWDAYRSEYIAFHELVRSSFRRIRDSVAERWAA